MHVDRFLDILKIPAKLHEDNMQELESIIKKYPYFQAARALYLKGLKDQDSTRYNHHLKSTAAHTSDRSILFDFIVSEEFNQNEISESIKRNTDYINEIEVKDSVELKVEKSVQIDDALKQQIQDTEGVLDPDLFEEKIAISKVAHLSSVSSDESDVPIRKFTSYSEDYDAAKSKLRLGAPLEFGPGEMHSFSEWMKLTTLKPIDRTPTKTPSETDLARNEHHIARENKIKIIDRFLDKNPKIVPSKEYSPKPLLSREEINHEGLMTETLARIYLEQKNYEKAIQSYKILSLKYPEKSTFFADQIQAVKDLQANN